ncbi:MAG TPA: hypothetical protein VKZ79_24510 [Alphaproteobacteria bacterium]|nr:hypothetical protein [Alphaproteobacteria bacterium]
MPTLTALFACSPDQAEQILCEAALHAGLAVGVVQDRFYDVMTTEEACAVLDDWEDEDTERPPH